MRGSVSLSSLLLIVWFLSGCAPSPGPTSPSATRIATLTPGSSPALVATPPLRTITPVTPPPTRSLNTVEVTFRWDVGAIITDVDDITELAVRLRDQPGILGAYGDEIQITVVYDPLLTTPEKIRRILDDLGFPAKMP